MSGRALVLLGCYGLVTLVFRVAVQLVRTGSTGVKGVSGRFGSVEWLAGVLFVVGIAAVVAGALLFDEVEPIDALNGAAGHAAGTGLAVVGIACTFAAQLAMGESWRIGVDEAERTALVTSGPFAIVRNPIYAGMVPFFTGIVLLVPTPLTLAAAGLLALGLELQTRLVEEPYLLVTHGDKYRDYARRVGRFLPGIGRIGGGAQPDRRSGEHRTTT